MKKLLASIFLIASSFNIFAQSLLLTPAEVNKTLSGGSNDDLILTRFGPSPSLISRVAGGSTASPTTVSSNTTLFFIGVRGYNGLSFTPTSSSGIKFLTSETWSSTASGSSIVFSTTTNGTVSRIDRFFINHDGNIGIGTNNPLKLLHLSQGTSGVSPHANAKVFIEDNAHTYLNIGTPDANESGILFGKASFGATSGGIIYTSARDLQFRTSTNDTRMVVTESGNVGIGTATPTVKLEVAGDTKINNEIQLDRGSPINVNTSIGFDPLDRGGHSYVIINTAAGQTAFIRGFTSAPAGTMLYLVVAGFGTTIIQDDNATNAANVIYTNNNSSVTITGQGSAIFIYDSGWRLLSFLQ